MTQQRAILYYSIYRIVLPPIPIVRYTRPQLYTIVILLMYPLRGQIYLLKINGRFRKEF